MMNYISKITRKLFNRKLSHVRHDEHGKPKAYRIDRSRIRPAEPEPAYVRIDRNKTPVIIRLREYRALESALIEQLNSGVLDQPMYQKAKRDLISEYPDLRDYLENKDAPDAAS